MHIIRHKYSTVISSGYFLCDIDYLRLTETKWIILIISLFYSPVLFAQQKATIDTAYEKVITERTGKIVQTLNITDPKQYNYVQQLLKDQYFQLNTIHESYKSSVASIKSSNATKESMDESILQLDIKKKQALMQLHTQFIAQLKASLTLDQVEKVKDGMTYRVLPVTWAAYMDMLQKLTDDQKKQMYAWLVEARELAMDESSSDAKHAVFGKYKGRINNYLSAQGYNMKKEGEDWQARIKADKEAKEINN